MSKIFQDDCPDDCTVCDLLDIPEFLRRKPLDEEQRRQMADEQIKDNKRLVARNQQRARAFDKANREHQQEMKRKYGECVPKLYVPHKRKAPTCYTDVHIKMGNKWVTFTEVFKEPNTPYRNAFGELEDSKPKFNPKIKRAVKRRVKILDLFPKVDKLFPKATEWPYPKIKERFDYVMQQIRQFHKSS